MTLFRRDIITVSRLPANTEDGAQGYGRADPGNAVALYSGIPADIQEKTEIRKPPANLPGDIAYDYFYIIFISARILARGSINVRDYITDQGGLVYQVNVPYWTIFGYQALCEKLII